MGMREKHRSPSENLRGRDLFSAQMASLAMKVNLYELEKEFAPEAMADAGDLLRKTRDFGLLEVDRHHFLFTSVAPDYQVEVVVKTGGQAVGKCDCAFFRRHNACKHALAALIAVRDLRKKDRTKGKADPLAKMMEDVLRKLNREELRHLVAAFAATHESFRHELLAGHLHKIAHPDYGALLAACAPTGTNGRMTLSRKQFKTLRTVINQLLQQTNERLQLQDVESALSLFESLIPFLFRVGGQDPYAKEALQSDVRSALRGLESLFRLPMAPRLYQRGVTLALDVAGRESYYLLPGCPIIIDILQPFILDRHDRQLALEIAAGRLATGKDDPLAWAGSLLRGLRQWPELAEDAIWKSVLAPWLPETVRALTQANQPEEALFAWQLVDPDHYPAHRLKPALLAVWQAARATGDKAMAGETAAYLTVAYKHVEALEWLMQQDGPAAKTFARDLHQRFPPEQDAETELIVVLALAEAGLADLAWLRLEPTENFSLLRRVEHRLLPTFAAGLEDWYVRRIAHWRATYGGRSAREKLSDLFNHLKSTGRYASVLDKLMKAEKNEQSAGPEMQILGFVFDLDGVIVDTAVHHFEAWRRILRQLGAEISEEDDEHTRGASRMESFTYLLDRYGIVLSEADKLIWAEKKNTLYLEFIAGITPDDLLPGAKAFLRQAREAGYKVGLGSASRNARGVLDRLQVAGMFDAIIDGNDVVNTKPNPEVFTKACIALGLPPDTVVVFEDAVKGIQAALAAGCHAVGIGDPQILGDADLVVRGLNELTPDDVLASLS